eukprot:620808-Pleurochrysis_carterae.AAC.1
MVRSRKCLLRRRLQARPKSASKNLCWRVLQSWPVTPSSSSRPLLTASLSRSRQPSNALCSQRGAHKHPLLLLSFLLSPLSCVSHPVALFLSFLKAPLFNIPSFSSLAASHLSRWPIRKCASLTISPRPLPSLFISSCLTLLLAPSPSLLASNGANCPGSSLLGLLSLSKAWNVPVTSASMVHSLLLAAESLANPLASPP